jgi:hypothetical protein
MKLKPIALLDLPMVRNRLDPGSMGPVDFRQSRGSEPIFHAVSANHGSDRAVS